LSGALPLLANAARARFGSMEAAIKAAGINDPTYHTPHKWTAGEILDKLRELNESTELSYKAVADWNIKIPNAAKRYFGSLRAAVKEAGLPYFQHPRSDRRDLRYWTEDVVLKTLRELHENREDIRYRTVKTERQPLFFAAKQLFGSYVNAVRVAGIDYWEMSQAHGARRPPTT
jgi:hypothetical protein